MGLVVDLPNQGSAPRASLESPWLHLHGQLPEMQGHWPLLPAAAELLTSPISAWMLRSSVPVTSPTVATMLLSSSCTITSFASR